MEPHRLLELLLQVLQIGEVAVDQVIFDSFLLPLPSALYSEVEEDVGLELVFVSFGSDLHFEPPFQIFELGEAGEVLLEDFFPQLFQVVVNFLR